MSGNRRREVRPRRLFFSLGLGLAAVLWGGSGWAAEPAKQLSEQERSAALLDAVGRSGARFVREGREYSAAAGRRHLERKLRHAGDRVSTAEQFIEGIASRSSTTGRPYIVKFPSGNQMETGPWLRQRLAEIDARR